MRKNFTPTPTPDIKNLRPIAPASAPSETPAPAAPPSSDALSAIKEPVSSRPAVTETPEKPKGPPPLRKPHLPARPAAPAAAPSSGGPSAIKGPVPPPRPLLIQNIQNFNSIETSNAMILLQEQQEEIRQALQSPETLTRGLTEEEATLKIKKQKTHLTDIDATLQALKTHLDKRVALEETLKSNYKQQLQPWQTELDTRKNNKEYYQTKEYESQELKRYGGDKEKYKLNKEFEENFNKQEILRLEKQIRELREKAKKDGIELG